MIQKFKSTLILCFVVIYLIGCNKKETCTKLTDADKNPLGYANGQTLRLMNCYKGYEIYPEYILCQIPTILL